MLEPMVTVNIETLTPHEVNQLGAGFSDEYWESGYLRLDAKYPGTSLEKPAKELEENYLLLRTRSGMMESERASLLKEIQGNIAQLQAGSDEETALNIYSKIQSHIESKINATLDNNRGITD